MRGEVISVLSLETISYFVTSERIPSRAQELLQYMTLIRHAAQTHRGLGWCIYYHKFRRKAALNLTLDWSVIDQQLWLMIFTTSPETQSQSYPLFSNGPQSRVSSGGERGGFCNEFNRTGCCSRQQCQYRHVCNKCTGPHFGRSMPSLPLKTARA